MCIVLDMLLKGCNLPLPPYVVLYRRKCVPDDDRSVRDSERWDSAQLQISLGAGLVEPSSLWKQIEAASAFQTFGLGVRIWCQCKRREVLY